MGGGVVLGLVLYSRDMDPLVRFGGSLFGASEVLLLFREEDEAEEEEEGVLRSFSSLSLVLEPVEFVWGWEFVDFWLNPLFVAFKLLVPAPRDDPELVDEFDAWLDRARLPPLWLPDEEVGGFPLLMALLLFGFAVVALELEFPTERLWFAEALLLESPLERPEDKLLLSTTSSDFFFEIKLLNSDGNANSLVSLGKGNGSISSSASRL